MSLKPEMFAEYLRTDAEHMGKFDARRKYEQIREERLFGTRSPYIYSIQALEVPFFDGELHFKGVYSELSYYVVEHMESMPRYLNGSDGPSHVKCKRTEYGRYEFKFYFGHSEMVYKFPIYKDKWSEQKHALVKLYPHIRSLLFPVRITPYLKSVMNFNKRFN